MHKHLTEDIMIIKILPKLNTRDIVTLSMVSKYFNKVILKKIKESNDVCIGDYYDINIYKLLTNHDIIDLQSIVIYPQYKTYVHLSGDTLKLALSNIHELSNIFNNINKIELYDYKTYNLSGHYGETFLNNDNIKYFSKAQELNIYCSDLNNNWELTDLSCLCNVPVIGLSNIFIEDISYLRGTKTLTLINCSNIKGITMLNNLNELTVFGQSSINDVSMMKNLTKISSDIDIIYGEHQTFNKKANKNNTDYDMTESFYEFLAGDF